MRTYYIFYVYGKLVHLDRNEKLSREDQYCICDQLAAEVTFEAKMTYKIELTEKELRDLVDILYIICGDCYDTIKLNKYDESMESIHIKAEKLAIPELYKNNVDEAKPR